MSIWSIANKEGKFFLQKQRQPGDLFQGVLVECPIWFGNDSDELLVRRFLDTLNALEEFTGEK